MDQQPNYETLKLLQENKDSAVCNRGITKHLLNRTPFTRELRPTIGKYDFIKLKSFYKAKEIINRVKKKHTEWDRIFARFTSDKRLISRIYEELKNRTPSKHELMKGAEFSKEKKERKKMSKKYLEGCL